MSAIARVLGLLVLCSLSYSQTNVLTGNGNNDRTNAMLQETQLSPATVNATNFGKLGRFPVDGQIYAQILYAGSLQIPGMGTRNVLFVATMHNSIYAFDADATATPMVLWHTNLGPSVPSALLFGPYGDIGGEVGILSTPVIDLQRGVIYAVSDNLVNGKAVFNIHALDLITGKEKLGGPVTISGSVRGTGSASSNGTVPFDPQQHIQRPGLLLANGAVYVTFGSHGDVSPFHGWMMSYDASDLTRQLGTFNATPNGDEGSFWQSGRGPAADDRGNIYAITGNGDYDGITNFGQSILKLAGAAPVRMGSFTPQDWKAMSDGDADLAAGPALISGLHKVIGADKSGNLYVLDSEAMSLSGVAEPNAFQVFPVSPGGIFNFAVWPRQDGAYLYVQGGRDPLKAFQITAAGFNPSPVSVISGPGARSRIGMTLSANGGQDGTGILWEITGNYDDVTTSGTLHAYDASNLSNELWNSGLNPADNMGPLVKFVGPTVANGRVYVPTLANGVMVYGILPPTPEASSSPVIAAVTSAASYAADAISPGEIIAIFGSNLGPAAPVGMQLDSTGAVTTMIGNTQVLFDGAPAPMVWAGASQVNAIVPFGVSGPVTQVQVQYQGQPSVTVPMAVWPAHPAVFTLDGSGAGQAIMVNQDGSINSAQTPAPARSVVVFYATGVGQFSPAGVDGYVVSADNLPTPVLPVSVKIGGVDAKVLYAGGAPGDVEGVVQINVQVPNTPGAAVPVILTVGSTSSQTVTMAVR